ncbi:putative kinase-related protein [Neofusicoccum parvum]|uniref:Kinase-related protein n=1 Tax=Neofusicoccum parvum TaxID=310453 RepID=A0ACB5SDQ6_9PEZI|nr:putative kinase-related protein [Neofusicoccum parvum]
MKTPVRAGTLASTFLILLVLCTILRHSEYLKDRWNHIDEIKGELAGGLKAHLGAGQTKTTSIDPKFIGFGTPEPASTPLPTPHVSTSEPTPAPGVGQPVSEPGESQQTDPRPEGVGAGAATNGLDDEQPPTPEAEAGDENDEAEAETDGADGDFGSAPLEALPDKVVVMGKTAEEDVTWVNEHLPDWQHAVYSVDDLNATLHTPMNKGKEAMAYLTYLIESYGNYPSTVAFIHSHQDRFWHSAGMPARSNMVALKALNIDYVQQVGFTNLRCTLGPGCPAEVQPYREDTPENRMYEKSMASVWELFFGTECPEVIAAPCCAQFAVSRDQIMMRPVEDYVLYRQWLMETDLDDENSGRVFEYLWHVMFGREPVHCPEYAVCWANVYGGPSMADLHRLLHGGGSL